jgi:hypothetical protein
MVSSSLELTNTQQAGLRRSGEKEGRGSWPDVEYAGS